MIAAALRASIRVGTASTAIADRIRQAPTISDSGNAGAPAAAVRKNEASSPASTLDARLTGTQNVFSRLSSSTSPPNTPVPCDRTPTRIDVTSAPLDQMSVKPRRTSAPMVPPPASATTARVSTMTGVATICSSTK